MCGGPWRGALTAVIQMLHTRTVGNPIFEKVASRQFLEVSSSLTVNALSFLSAYSELTYSKIVKQNGGRGRRRR